MTDLERHLLDSNIRQYLDHDSYLQSSHTITNNNFIHDSRHNRTRKQINTKTYKKYEHQVRTH